MKNDEYHIPVLLNEVIRYLRVEKGKRYIDATLGGGGHTEEILRLGGEVLGIDVDEDSILNANNRFKKNKSFTESLGNFREIDKIAHLKGFNKVFGIIFDLGVSSHQIDTPQRGFSFLSQGPLDMRMGKSLGVKAADLVNILTKGELYDIFNNLGQEHNARAISDAIFRARRIRPIRTTLELEKVIENAYGITNEKISDFRKNEICKKVFQALRIIVNSELENLKEALPKAIDLLETKGRLAVISFHSLEDRIVKEMFKDFEKKNMGEILTKKPITPSEEELERNPRSSSSKLRVFEKN